MEVEVKKELKNILKSKIYLSIEKLKKTIDNNSISRIQVKQFSEILHKQIDRCFYLYHDIYKTKNFEFFNEEEATDFLIFENNLVYVDYNDNLYNFHKVHEDEKLINVDLGNQELYFENLESIDKNESYKANDEYNKFENLSDEISDRKDLISLNYFPICLTHSYLTIFCEQNFPQVLSNEFIIETLQIFTLTQNSSLRLGYNSLGGGCLINHLHFELLYLDDFDDINILPIEKSEKFNIFETRLINKNSEEISMFDGNTIITISKVNFPIICWKVEAQFGQEFQNAIANCVNFLLSELIDAQVPHNLLISDMGQTFYIIPRQFDNANLSINTCWTDMCGLISVKDENLYHSTNQLQDVVRETFKYQVSISDSAFNQITVNFVNKFQDVYLINLINLFEI